MERTILVAYATRMGSTEEVAQAIAEALREAGLEAETQPAKLVRDLAGYDAVVLGAPLYFFRWHKDARRFLRRHRRALQELPVAIFALGPTEDTEEHWQGAREHLDKALAEAPWLSPVAVEVFGGRFEQARLWFPFSLLPAMGEMPEDDLRDWDAIRAWARDLAEKLASG